MRKFKKKTKRKRRKNWKKEAWKWFSIYVRLKYANKSGYVKCYTCSKVLFWKGEGMQAGHFQGGRGNAVLLDEEGVRVQCLTEESNVRLFNGVNKSVKDVKLGEKIWGFNEKSFEREVCVVESIDKFMPEKLYEVEMENGDKFYATGDHKVVANGKWLRIDYMLHNFTDYDILEL